jgi:hypothetical protein
VNDSLDERLERIERLLEQRNALAREAMALQREALDAQRSALAESKELVGLQRANIEHAGEVNRRAGQVAEGARKFLLVLLPIVVVLIGYVSWLIFFRIRA